MRDGGDRRPFVIAVDAGGTHTRVGCFSPAGALLSLATGRGGSPDHNDDARENVSRAVVAALDSAGLSAEDAIALAAGVAGVNQFSSNQGSGDNRWTESFFAVPGLRCPRVVVNDAVIAHRGALGGRAGVIVVAGTGSMIMVITASGEEFESGHLQHYAGGARHLVYDAVERILTARPFPATDPLTRELLRYWDARDGDELRRRLVEEAGSDRNERKRRFGDFAPVVTGLADTSPVADAAVRALTFKTAQGVRLLAPLVGFATTPVALAGAVATDAAFTGRLRTELNGDVSVELCDAALDPLAGAAIIACRSARIPVGDHVLDRLRARTVAGVRTG